MDRLFAVIARINSVLFLIALLGICGLIAYWTWSAGQFKTRGQIEVGAANPKTKSTILLEMELTRFSGHLMVRYGGVRDGNQECQVYARV